MPTTLSSLIFTGYGAGGEGVGVVFAELGHPAGVVVEPLHPRERVAPWVRIILGERECEF